MNDRQDKSELFKRFAAGDESAIAEIIDLYKNELYNFLRRFIRQSDLVEDVFQETFLQLYLSSSKFDPSRNLRPWLFTIAANKAKDALRKNKKKNDVVIIRIGEIKIRNIVLNFFIIICANND